MLRNLVIWILGLSIKIVSVKEGDTLIFEANEYVSREHMDWYATTLRKYFKHNLVVLQGISLKTVVRKEK